MGEEREGGTGVQSAEERRQHESCEEQLARIRLNPNVLYLQKAMKKKGCGGAALRLQCVQCAPLGAAGAEAFFSSDGAVSICEDQQSLVSNSTEAAVLHELVHAYDFCRAELTPTCEEVACTEIRASLLSGECGFTKELARGQNGVRKQLQRCVRRRVELSMAMHPECGGLRGEKAVSDVWEACYADREPFGTMPRHMSAPQQ